MIFPPLKSYVTIPLALRYDSLLRYVMARPKRYANDAEKMKAYRARKAGLDLGEKETEVQTESEGIEMASKEIPLDEDSGSMLCPACGGYEEHRVECKGKPVVVMPRKCDACGRTWGSTTETPCPYCRGKGKVLTA